MLFSVLTFCPKIILTFMLLLDDVVFHTFMCVYMLVYCGELTGIFVIFGDMPQC